MSYKRKRPGKFKYILARVGNKFSWLRKSDIRGIFQKVRINSWKRLWKKWPDEKKVRLLLVKFGAAEHKKYVNFILPKQPDEVMFRKTIQILTKIFGEQNSLFNNRWQCFNLTNKDCEDYTTFASTVNRYCERVQQNEITPDMFKCLIFIQRLTSPSEKEVRTKSINQIRTRPKNKFTKPSWRMPAYFKFESWHS